MKKMIIPNKVIHRSESSGSRSYAEAVTAFGTVIDKNDYGDKEIGYGKGNEARIDKGYGDVNFKIRQTLPKDETGIVTLAQRRNHTSWILYLILVFSLVFVTPLHAAIWDVLGQGDIPIYPAMQKTSEQNLTVNGVGMKMVFLKAESMSIAAAVDYYKKILGQKGWQTQGETMLLGSNVFITFMSPDQRMFSLQFLSGSMVNKPNYVLVRMMYTLEGFDKMQRMIPTDSNRDMPGEDISWLKRYPQSIRTNSTSDDQGYITVSYTVQNYNCIECIAEFYTQQLTQKRWSLLETSQITKEELNAQNAALEKMLESSLKIAESKLETLMPQMPEEVMQNLQKFAPAAAEKLNQTIKDYLKESIKNSAQSQVPERIKKLSFKNKGGDLCVVTISYSSPTDNSRGRLLDLLGLNDEQKEIYSKYMKEASQNNRMFYHMGLQFQERVDITIMYIPESKLKERAKTWF